MATDTKLTLAERRAALIQEKIEKGLPKARAEEAADRQLARDAKPINIKKLGGPSLAERVAALEERLDALEGNKPAKAK